MSDYEIARVVIPALGSVSGGIIGGIVAVLIATYNVKRSSISERKRQMQTTLSLLLLLREELKDNISILETILEHPDAYTKLLKQLADDTWRSSAVCLLINERLLIRLNVVYRKIGILKMENEFSVDLVANIKQTASSVFDDIVNEIAKIENDLK